MIEKSNLENREDWYRLVTDCAQSLYGKFSILDSIEENYESFSLEDKKTSISYYRDKSVTYRIFRVVGDELIPLDIKGLKILAYRKRQELDSKRRPYKRFENTYTFRKDPVPHTRKGSYRWVRYRHPVMKRVVIDNTDPEYEEFIDPEYRRIRDGWYDCKMSRLGNKSWKKNHKCRKQYMKHW